MGRQRNYTAQGLRSDHADIQRTEFDARNTSCIKSQFLTCGALMLDEALMEQLIARWMGLPEVHWQAHLPRRVL